METTFTLTSASNAPDSRHVVPATVLDDLLEIVVSRRLKKGWRVQVDFRTGERVLVIPEVLADPPPHVRECLIRWAMMPMTRKARRNAAYVNNRRSMEETIRAYMESKGVAQERKSRVDPATFERQTSGVNFDLREIFDTLNNAYFNGGLKSYLRWGNAASRTSYHTARADRSGNIFNLITIAGVYDSPKVPEFAIYGLMYHEMLHIAIPPRAVNGRRVIHGKAFKAAERKYPFYDRWIAWEKEHMPHLIINARRRQKRQSGRR